MMKAPPMPMAIEGGEHFIHSRVIRTGFSEESPPNLHVEREVRLARPSFLWLGGSGGRSRVRQVLVISPGSRCPDRVQCSGHGVAAKGFSHEVHHLETPPHPG